MAMTDRQKQLVRETYPRVIEMASPLSQLFYGQLFQMAPSVRPLFRGDIRVQGRKLMDMLKGLIECIDDTQQNLTLLRALGQRHAGYGVKPEHYDTVKAAFGWSLGQVLQSEYSGDVKAAWLALIDEVNGAMKAGAAELSAQKAGDAP